VSWSPGNLLVTLLAFLVAVFVLVTVHEFGHYWVARRLGFKVLRFSVGFGKPLWKRVAGADQTEYTLGMFPVGGYVKLLDEREGPVAAAELERAFTRRPHWQRIAVLLAGPAFNFVFAVLVLTGLLWVRGVSELKPVVATVTADSLAGRAGLRGGDEIIAVNGVATSGQESAAMALFEGVSRSEPVQLRLRDGSGGSRTVALTVADDAERRRLSDPNGRDFFTSLGFRFQLPTVPAVVGTVVEGGPAARAGILPGDRIVGFNGGAVSDFNWLAQQIMQRPGAAIVLRVRRTDGEHDIRLTVDSDLEDGRAVGRIRISNQVTAGDLGPLYSHTQLGPVAAISMATTQAWDLTVLQARFLWRMIAGQVSLNNIGGPITIAQVAGQSAQAGFDTFFGFLIRLSLALCFFNLLPVPLLDGGQVLMQAIEWIKGSPLSERVQLLGQQVGIMMVALMLGLALFIDIARNFG
jgi:regulator of sigma E protease